MNKIMKCLLCLITAVLVFQGGRFSLADEVSRELMLKKGEEYCFRSRGILTRILILDKYKVMQGGGRDDNFAYYAMLGENMKSRILKYDLRTWKCMGISEPLFLGHANDISYDVNRHLLGIAGTYDRKIIYVDQDDLQEAGSEMTLASLSRLAYLPDGSGMIGGAAYQYILFYDDDFMKAVNTFECQGSRYTTQGMTTDGKYIYDIGWNDIFYGDSLLNKQRQHSYIVIHNIDGEYIGDYPVYGIEGEPENIIHLENNRFAIGCNGSNCVYMVELTYE